MPELEDEQNCDDLRFLQEMINAVRADAPEETEWQTARRKLMEQLRTSRRGNVVMNVFRKAHATKIRWVASAAAVAAVIALGVMFSFWDRHEKLAFGEVLEQIRVFRPYTCTSTTQSEGKPAFAKRIMRLSLSRRREIWPDGRILVFDLSRNPNKTLILIPQNKWAVEKTLTGTRPRSDPDLLRILSAMRDGPARDLGTRKVDGQTAQGFHAPDEVNEWTVWADPKTGLPIRIELFQQTIGRKIVMRDFKFDIDFDKSLFSTTAPKDYTVRKVEKDGTNPTEQDLIEGLRAVAVFLDGNFPPAFDSRELRKVLAEHVKRKKPSASEEEMNSLSRKVERAVRYVAILEDFKKVGHLRYLGEGVELGDGDSPVLWWCPRASRTYRVIYGDLTVRDVTPENLPSSDQASDP